MKGNLYQIISETIDKYTSNNILNVQNTNEYITLLRNWLKTLDYKGRAPKGMKKFHTDLNALDSRLKDITKYYNNDVEANPDAMRYIDAMFSWYKISDIDTINKKFSNVNKFRILKLNNGTYINESIISEKRFRLLSNEIDKFLSSLKGFHKKILKPSLKIYFVKKAKTKATATYKSEQDIILIRPDKIKAFNDEYASISYIILHELGHRFEKYNKLPTDFYTDEWYTTPYSKTPNSWKGEQFAELFAISHWYNKYKSKYKKILDEFIKIME